MKLSLFLLNNSKFDLLLRHLKNRFFSIAIGHLELINTSLVIDEELFTKEADCP